MMALASSGVVSVWLVLFIAAPAVLLIAGHLLALRASEAPESTKRIRTASGVLMLAMTPALVYLFGFASADEPRGLILSWGMVVGLLGIIVILAILDTMNSSRIHAAERRRMRQELELTRRKLATSGESGSQHAFDR